jgi:DNA-binding winged helix-turn-helix (wHTH) protein/Tfp pilus assembly protein PilF/TolB-like protein
VTVLRLGEFELKPATRELSRAGVPVRLTQKPFQVLLYLVEHRDRLVPRAELLEKFWGGREVYDVALTRCLSFVRKALDDQGETARYIETRWAEGYRYIGPLERVDMEPPAAPPKRHGICWRCVATGAAIAVVVACGGWLWWAWMQPGPSQRFAVLPVRTGAAEAWLGEALTDRIVSTLAKIEGLTVLAPRSADLARLRDEGHADAFLDAKAELDAGSVRIQVTLVSARDNSVLWTFETEHPRADLMKAEREIAIALASHLAARLRQGASRPRDAEAYAHYLRGRFLWNQRTAPALHEAIAEYGAAIAREPGFADAHAGLAEATLLQPLYAGEAPAPARARARTSAEEALRLDPYSARAHTVLAIIAQYDWDWAAVDRNFARARQLEPGYATAAQWWGESLCYRRRFEECRALLVEARSLDPLSPVIAMTVGNVERWAGNLDAAAREYDGVKQRWPGFVFVEYQLANLAVARGDWEDAIARFKAIEDTMGVALVGGVLVHALARSGRPDEARALDARLRSRSGYIPPSVLSVAAIGLGERDRALAEIARSIEVRDEFTVYLAVDERMVELAGDPGYEALVTRIGIDRKPPPKAGLRRE